MTTVTYVFACLIWSLIVFFLAISTLIMAYALRVMRLRRRLMKDPRVMNLNGDDKAEVTSSLMSEGYTIPDIVYARKQLAELENKL
jgi:hypothetical protein